MKALFKFVLVNAFVLVAIASQAQIDRHHPYLDETGQVVDSAGIKLGWVTTDGLIFNARADRMGMVVNQIVYDNKRQKIGTIGTDGSYKTLDGVTHFYLDNQPAAHRIKVLDPNGHVIATVHDSYKRQAIAIQFLAKH